MSEFLNTKYWHNRVTRYAFGDDDGGYVGTFANRNTNPEKTEIPWVTLFTILGNVAGVGVRVTIGGKKYVLQATGNYSMGPDEDGQYRPLNLSLYGRFNSDDPDPVTGASSDKVLLFQNDAGVGTEHESDNDKKLIRDLMDIATLPMFTTPGGSCFGVEDNSMPTVVIDGNFTTQADLLVWANYNSFTFTGNNSTLSVSPAQMTSVVKAIMEPDNTNSISEPTRLLNGDWIEVDYGNVALVRTYAYGAESTRSAIGSSAVLAQYITRSRNWLQSWVERSVNVAVSSGGGGVDANWRNEVRQRFTDVDDAISAVSDVIVQNSDRIIDVLKTFKGNDEAALQALKVILKQTKRSTLATAGDVGALVGAGASALNLGIDLTKKGGK